MKQFSRNYRHLIPKQEGIIENHYFAMSNEKEDERRLYQCVRKYGKILKQFDEVIELLNARTKPPKRRRIASGPGENSSATTPAPASSTQPHSNQVFVETITGFLQELRADSTTEPDCSTSNPNPKQGPT